MKKKLLENKHLTTSAQETRDLGEIFGQKILASLDSPNIFALKGNLGSGKTTFMQGVAKGLGIKEKILSPTFVVMKSFRLNSKNNLNKMFHFDCYRLTKPEDLEDLDFFNIISNEKNLIFLEWPEKIKKALPKKITTIKFKNKDKNKREIIFK